MNRTDTQDLKGPPLFKDRGAFETALAHLPMPDEQARTAALQRQQQLTKPSGSLGRLEEIAVFLAGWQERPIPLVQHTQVIVFAGNHGVTRQGVSPFPSDVTRQMVENFKRGGAAINALSEALGLHLTVMALDLEKPTGDISTEAALSEGEVLDALNAGASVIHDDTDLLIFGEMGIGNTTIAAALCAASFGGSGADWAGPGTGLDRAGVSRKAAVIDKALARHGTRSVPAFDVLRSLGGRELCAIAGGVLAARLRRIPVLLDGYVVCAALAPLATEEPRILDHCLAGHCSAEPAHRHLLAHLRLVPLLDLGMRLGEGTGAALAASVVCAAVAAHAHMATFAEAGVSDREKKP